MIYLDTSAMVSLFLTEGRTASVQRLVADTPEEIGISELAVGEFSAAVMTGVRAKRLTQAQADFAIEGADSWINAATARLEIAREDFRAAIDFVRCVELGLLLPDALHLATCRRHAATLVTGDKRQADAAAIMGMPVVRV